MHISGEQSDSKVPSATSAGQRLQYGKRERLAIWLLLVSSFTVILNETIMGVALPELMQSLNITASAGQWLTTAFLLTMSVVIPITGMLIQRYSTRQLFIFAMVVFTAGTLLSAVAPGFEVLLIGRVIQACGTAIMMPLLMTTVTTMVPVTQRGQVMGRIAIVMSVAPALGPTISGFILQWLSWRWLFLFVLPIAVISLVLGAIRMPNVGDRRVVKIDVISVLLSVVGFGGIVYGLSSMGGHGSTDAAVSPLVALLGGLIAIALFVWRQLVLQRTERALLDLRTFSSKPFSLSVILLGFSAIALFGSLILLPLYMQTVLGADTLLAGLVLLPGGLLMGVCGPLVGRIVDKRGARVVLVPGAIVTAGSLWAMAALTDTSSIWHVLATHLLLSLGLAGVFTPVFAVSLGSLPRNLASHGSAIISTVQQVAGAAGTALFITVMTLVSTASAGSATVDAADLSSGTSVAFAIGGLAATIGAVIAFFITEPKQSPAFISAPSTGAADAADAAEPR